MTYPSYFTDMPSVPPGGPNPPLAVRVVSGIVWEILHQQWRDSLQFGAPPPRLGPPAAPHIFFTDAQSLAVCTRAEDFGLRLTMAAADIQDIRISGCALIFFSPSTADIERPSPAPAYGVTPSLGLTVGGAREWILRANPAMDPQTMEAFFVNPSSGRWGPIPA